MNIRGDGRKYMINLKVKRDFDILWNDRWHYPLYTRGGPYWQYVKIPWSKFFLGSRGRIQDRQSWFLWRPGSSACPSPSWTATPGPSTLRSRTSDCTITRLLMMSNLLTRCTNFQTFGLASKIDQIQDRIIEYC